MLWLRLVYIFLACFICSIGAGIGIVRRLIKEPKLALATTIGMSGIVLYLSAGLIYVSGLSWNWAYLVTAICFAQIIRNAKELRRWWDDLPARDMLIAWALLQLWIFLVNLNLRHFAIWISDWQEHYARALFFLQHWSVWSKLGGGYFLPARPPMMNIIEGLMMAQAGSTYDCYQIVSGFLNAALFLPVAGLACDWSGRRMAKIVVPLMALSPWFMQNDTYPWTKLYCAFYVVLAIWLYRRQFRMLALMMLTAGSIVHYSAVVVAVYVAIYDLCVYRSEWRRIAVSWALCAALMMTWVGWAWSTYRWQLMGSTSTIMEANRHSRTELIRNLASNAYLSIIPRGFQPIEIDWVLRSHIYLPVRIRDEFFLAYEPGLIWAWGVGGMLVMIWALRNARFRGNIFWVGFVICNYVGGLLVCTPEGYDLGGVAHIVLQPIVWIGLAWLVSQWPRMPRWLVKIWLAGVFFDMCWLMFHFALESRLLKYIKYPNGYAPADRAAASFNTLANGLFLIERNLRMLGMDTLDYDSVLLAAMIGAALLWWISLRRAFGPSRSTALPELIMNAKADRDSAKFGSLPDK